MEARIIRNGCECEKSNPVQMSDVYKTIRCDNCFQIISYEKPPKGKRKREKKVTQTKEGQEVVTVNEGGKNDQILINI